MTTGISTPQLRREPKSHAAGHHCTTSLAAFGKEEEINVLPEAPACAHILIITCILQVREYVKDVMDIVELTPLRNTLVGIPGESGLSVEQRKRLTIAVELVANPSVIFMDEPTSGEASGVI